MNKQKSVSNRDANCNTKLISCPSRSFTKGVTVSDTVIYLTAKYRSGSPPVLSKKQNLAMTFKKLIKSDGLITNLFNKLKIKDKAHFIVEIDHNPDYSLTSHKREIGSDYIFMHYCQVPDIFDHLFSAQIIKCDIFFNEHLAELSTLVKNPFLDNVGSLLT